MRVLLGGLLPRLFPGLQFLCVPHEGKQDLEKSIPRKLRAWREPGVRFAIIRDKDAEDCVELKKRLVGLCSDSGRPEALVRIACQELEAWYLGEPEALAEAFENESLRALGGKARFRDPDSVVQPARALGEVLPEFQKVSGARLLSMRLSRDRNRSRSFQTLLKGIEREAAALTSVQSGP